MTEVLDDIRVSSIETAGDRGLNFSSEETRIKHTGEGEFEMLSYGNIEIKTELKPYRRYDDDSDDDDPIPPTNEELGNIEIEAVNQISIEAEGEDTEESVALTIEAENGSIEIEAKKKIEITAESDDEDAIEIEAEHGGIKIHAEGCETGNVEIEAKLNVEITAKGRDEDAIEIEAEHGGIKIHAEGCETGNIEIEAKLSIEISADANDEEAIEIEAKNGGISIQAGEETNENGVIEIVAYSSDCEAINITAVNGGIEIKTQACEKDIKLITQEHDSVIIPHKLKAGSVYQSYDPQSEPTGPYALLVPTGAIMPYAGSSVPGGWLFCDGSAYSSETYPRLYCTIGTLYGNGDEGANNFNVPDLRSRFPLGAGEGPGLTARVLAVMNGQEVITTVPPHTHDFVIDGGITHYPSSNVVIDISYQNHGINIAGSYNVVTSDNTKNLSVTNTGTNIHSPSVDIMNPFLVLNYIIKV